jgi:hypothetical protein
MADRDRRMTGLVDRAYRCHEGVLRCLELAKTPGSEVMWEGVARTALAYTIRQRECLFHAGLVKMEALGAVAAEFELRAKGLK